MIERHLLSVAEESLRGFRVTVINGPRQSGKTTLAKQLVTGVGSYWSLDNESVRAAARLDPHGFVEQGSSPMAIDEVQRGGNDVVLAVKSVVDRCNDRGQFVLAGSTRFLSVPQLSESLAGRAEINANPKDTKDYAQGVWTLPPILQLKDVDKEKYLAIGESDRMTLKFVKPAVK